MNPVVLGAWFPRKCLGASAADLGHHADGMGEVADVVDVAALAGIQWEILMEAQDQAKQSLAPDDLLEIRYEDLCENATGIFETATQFCSLEWSSKFRSTVQSKPLTNTNDKWRQDLGIVQQKQLDECIQHTLSKYGYV